MLDRQKQARIYKSSEGEFSIFWPGGSNDDEGAKDNSIEEEKN
jgi:hypothetical protein